MRRKKLLMVVLAMVLCVGFTVTVLPSGKAHAKVINLKVANYFPPPANQSKVLEDTELYISEIMYDSKQLDDPYAKPYSLAQDYIMEQMIDSQYGRN